jgi:hypothetical protein
MSNTSLSVLYQVPEFIRSDYPQFLAFLQTYYKWYEEVFMPGKFSELTDIDLSIAPYVEQFQKQYDVYGISVNLTNQRFLLKHIKDIYKSKGSARGFEMLFRAIFNTDVSIITPWDYVFKTSAGQWTQDISIFVKSLSENIGELVSQLITVVDNNNKEYQTYVKALTVLPNNVYELFITRFAPTTDQELVSFYTSDKSISGSCLKTTIGIDIFLAGTGFKAGQVYSADSFSGKGTLVKIKQVDKFGGIRSVEIIKYGSGYTTDFNILVSPSGSLGAASLQSRIQLGELIYKTKDYTNTQFEQGLIVRHNYTNIDNHYLTDPTYVGSIAGEITTNNIENIQDNQNYASLTLKIGSICVYPGYYQKNNNIIGDSVYLQDSFFYQTFSYQTSSILPLDTYRNIVRQGFHPAGTKHFGRIDWTYTIDFNTVMIPALNIISKDDALRDNTKLIESIRFDINAYFETQFSNIVDAFKHVANYIRQYSDQTSGLIDSITKTFTKYSINDSITIQSVIKTIPGITFSDKTTIISALALTPNKNISDVVVTGFTDFSGAYGTEWYVEPLSPMPYWKPTYTETERAFTN